MLAMIVNDKAGNLTSPGVHGLIASKFVPAVMHYSHPPILGHGQRIAVADDEMIQHPHIDQLQRLLQTLGQHPISLTGVGVP